MDNNWISVKVDQEHPVISWWSGGVTSAVACKLAISLFGVDNVRIVFIDTKNEDIDTYRFKNDCQKWYGKDIEIITNEKYSDITEVWFKFLSLNVAHGAICSSELKREVRQLFQKENLFSYQIFGFDIDEPKRAKSLAKNYAESRPIFPLLMRGLSKNDCIKIVEARMRVPSAYYMGFNNNNCLKTGCVQGGIGYWQKMKKEKGSLFYQMGKVEHDLTNLKGEPVTMLKDQSKDGGLVFLIPHPDYPNIKDISMMKGRPPKPLFECNGLCGTNDLEKNETESEINYAPPSPINEQEK